MSVPVTHCRFPGQNPRRRGFTLPEVLISMIIVGFMFLAFYATLDTGVSSMRVARENLRATQIMLNRMEGIRLYQIGQLTNSAMFPTNFIEVYDPVHSNSVSDVTYTGVVTIASAPMDPPATYYTNLYLITVQVTWTSGNALRTRQLSTYSALNGEQNYVYSSN